ncbi:hypothetical protein VTJ83DRAFT_4329 [Remersonia thermophila]|uniref:Transmembrane protein 42 n=1 Tax=Remersonia thermophila TaxID=72144 RepID=A0ABR4D9L4_9PEZI
MGPRDLNAVPHPSDPSQLETTMRTLRPRKPKPGPSTTTLSQPEAIVEPSPSSVSSAVSGSEVRKRRAENEKRPEGDKMSPLDEERPLLAGHSASSSLPSESPSWSQRNQWILLALASGACAAFNGVFAKLTTTELTTSLSSRISSLLGLDKAENVVEWVVRGSFFGLNLTFNGVMWTLFTTALARGHSTTQVSIMNTSANFVLTALLGSAIFSEALPPLWWLGATMLVAGNVIIGRKDEGRPSRGPESEQRGEISTPSGRQDESGESTHGK